MASRFGGGYDGGYGRPQLRFGGPLTPVVKVLLIINAAVFLFTMLPSVTEGGSQAVGYINYYFGMTPSIFWSQFTLWMPFTYMFIHAGFMHILFNMFALWMFGGDVEKVFGARNFIIYYMICGAGAGLLVAALQPGMSIPTVGASGAIYGLLLAFGLFFPERVIYLYGIVPVKSKYFVIGVGAIVFLSSLGGSGGGISHIAHLGGFVIGFIFLRWRRISQFFRGVFRRKPKRKADVIDMEELRRMFEENDEDQKIH